MPRAKQLPTPVSCQFCGKSFPSARGARFCPAPATDGKRKTSPCQVAFGNLMAKRGKVLAPYVMAWIAGRGGGHAGTHPVAGPAMREITSIARSFIDEDKKEGRPSTIGYVESLLADGLYIDRKPKRKVAE